MAIFSAINENTELVEDRQFKLSHPMLASLLIAKWILHLRNCIQWSGWVKLDRFYLLPFSNLAVWSFSRDDERDYVRHVILPLEKDDICLYCFLLFIFITSVFFQSWFGHGDNINALIANENTLLIWINIASPFL